VDEKNPSFGELGASIETPTRRFGMVRLTAVRRAKDSNEWLLIRESIDAGLGSLKIGHLPGKIGIEQPLARLSREVDCSNIAP
jgi:hypothetical protein